MAIVDKVLGIVVMPPAPGPKAVEKEEILAPITLVVEIRDKVET